MTTDGHINTSNIDAVRQALRAAGVDDPDAALGITDEREPNDGD